MVFAAFYTDFQIRYKNFKYFQTLSSVNHGDKIESIIKSTFSF